MPVVYSSETVDLNAWSETRLRRYQQTGCSDDLDALVSRHRPRILRFFVSSLTDVDHAEDATQKVFVRMIDNAHRFPTTSTFMACLAVIRNSVLANELRGRTRAMRMFTRYGIQPPEVAEASDPTPEDLLHYKDIRTQVEHALVQLHPADGHAFHLHQIEGFTLTEVAAMDSIPLGTAKTRTWRARRHVRDRLAPHVEDWMPWRNSPE